MGKKYFFLKSFFLPIPLPKKNIIYFGDGFLSLCKTDAPFWLIKNNNKVTRKIKLFSKKEIFYYLFNIDRKKESINYIKINKDFINKIIDDLIKVKFNKINNFNKSTLCLKRKELFIFPTSTFYETSRSTLDNEIKMYLDYIISNTKTSRDIICIKPHPGSNLKKTNILEKKLKNIGYELFYWKNCFNSLDGNYIPFGELPLEIFITLLIKKFHLNYNNFKLVVSSNASLSCLILHPKLITVNAFSDFLVKKYLNKPFIENRLEQELLIEEYIKEIIGN